jgi:hypothetical protein
VSMPTAPTASRLRPPTWRDTRLLVGVLLVLLATVAGSVVVASADDRMPVYAARHALVPGQPLTGEDLVRLDVQLGDATAAYLPAGEPLMGDRFVLRGVPAGDLVPLSALGRRDDVDVRPLTLRVDETSATALVVGSVVDVYANPPAPGGRAGDYAGPRLVLEGVSVSRVPTGSGSPGLAGPTSSASVQVMAPTNRVRHLIGLVDDGARVTLVPVPGSVVRTDS